VKAYLTRKRKGFHEPVHSNCC